MAIYHLSVKNISRGDDDRSAVACAAYRAGARLWNAFENAFSDFSARGGVAHAEIVAPEGAALWAHDREQLWNRAEAAEKRKDARLAKEIEIALPRELPRADQVRLIRTFAAKLTAMGLVVDFSIHDDEDGNPHVHMMVTTRPLSGDGFGPKDRKLDSKAFVLWARKGWEELTNAALGAAGQRVRVDSRSLKAQGITREPTKHRGPRGLARAHQRDRAAERTAERPTVSNTPSRSVSHTREGSMDRKLELLISIQEDLSASASADETPAEAALRKEREAELLNQRERLLKAMDREVIVRADGLDARVRHGFLDLWDEAHAFTPEDMARQEEEGRRFEEIQRDPRKRTWDELSRAEKEQSILTEVRLDELKAERADPNAREGKMDRKLEAITAVQKELESAAEKPPEANKTMDPVTRLMHMQERLLRAVDRQIVVAARGLEPEFQQRLLAMWDALHERAPDETPRPDAPNRVPEQAQPELRTRAPDARADKEQRFRDEVRLGEMYDDMRRLDYQVEDVKESNLPAAEKERRIAELTAETLAIRRQTDELEKRVDDDFWRPPARDRDEREGLDRDRDERPRNP